MADDRPLSCLSVIFLFVFVGLVWLFCWLCSFCCVAFLYFQVFFLLLLLDVVYILSNDKIRRVE